MQIAIIGILILCNGLLSMSEFAIVSSRRHRLRKRAKAGSRGARVALELIEDPGRFLSSVQIGITLVGILAGAYGGAAIADELAATLGQWERVSEIARPLSIGIVVGATTYLTLVIGELVPKQIAIREPERVASLVALPMRVLATVTFPIVVLLNASTKAVLWVLGQRKREKEAVTEDEVHVLLKQGEESGVFRRAETQMVAGVFRLDDIRADALMTPRVDIAWLDVDAGPDQIRAELERSRHSRYPVCEATADRVVGVVDTGTIATRLLRGEHLNLRELAQPAEFVPESANAGELVHRVALTGRHFLIVLSEHGGMDGVVTAHDLAEAVLGDLGEPDAERIDARSWRISGRMPIEEVEAILGEEGMREDDAKGYGTLGGFVMDRLGRIAVRGDEFRWSRFRFQVTDVAARGVRQVTVTAEEPDPSA